MLKTVLNHISTSKFVKNSTLFLVFNNVVKHGLSCFIYHFNLIAYSSHKNDTYHQSAHLSTAFENLNNLLQRHCSHLRFSVPPNSIINASTPILIPGYETSKMSHTAVIIYHLILTTIIL